MLSAYLVAANTMHSDGLKSHYITGATPAQERSALRLRTMNGPLSWNGIAPTEVSSRDT